MGIEDYEFLTRTMKKISKLSSELTEKKDYLSNLKKTIKSMRDEVIQTKKKIRNSEGLIYRSSSQNEDKKLTLYAVNKEMKTLNDKTYGIRKSIEKSTLAPWMNRLGSDKDDDWTLLFFVSATVLTLLYLFGMAFGLVGFECDNGKRVFGVDVNDGNNDCGDGSDESLEGAELKSFELRSNILLGAATLAFFLYPPIANSVDKKKMESANRAISVIDMEKWELKKQRNELSRVKDLSDGVKLHHQFVEEGEEWLETAQQGVSDREKTIKGLEGDLAALWDSIAHLIPYSSALEKA